MNRFSTIEDLIDNLPSDTQFVFHNKEMIETVMDSIPLAEDFERYRLALFLKAGDYRHPTERSLAFNYSKILEDRYKARYFGSYSLQADELLPEEMKNPTDEDCVDGFVMINGKCVPTHQVEEGISGEVYEEVGYYNEADLVPPITSSTYRVPKENKRRKMSYYGGAK